MAAWLNNSKKAIGALLTSALAWGYAVVASESSKITAEEWLGLAGIAITTLTVYWVKNTPPAANAMQPPPVNPAKEV